jgi:DNA repair exonuclease SbcCD nuclease subunit
MINNIHIKNTKHLYFCGDIHGEFHSFRWKLDRIPNAVLIACGDIGMGFNQIEYYHEVFENLNLKLSEQNTYLLMLRGNHDDPKYFDGSFREFSHIRLLPDYSVISVGDTNVLCIGGATSVDRTMRIGNEIITGKKTYWSDAELPIFDEQKLDEINQQFENSIHIVATHTCPSFAYPATKGGILYWLQKDENLKQTLEYERAIMDKIFFKLKESQNNITDWYYGHYHQHHLEQHHDINFRLCDLAELNEFRRNENSTKK